MYLLGRKVYFSASLQIHIVIYQYLLAKYDYIQWDKVLQLSEKFLSEGPSVAITILQVSLSTSNTATRSMVTMRRPFWMQSSGIPKEV